MNKTSKGLSLRFLSYFLTALAAMVFIFILILTNAIFVHFKSVSTELDKFIACQNSSKLIKESANYLTEQARLFIITENPAYAKAYLEEKNIKRGREKALENLQKVCSTNDLAYQRLQIAQNQSENLINIEMYAIKLVYEGNPELKKIIPEEINNVQLRITDKKMSSKELKNLALETLFGDGYLIYKTRVDENCNLTVESIEENIKKELQTNSNELGIKLRKLKNLIIFLFVVAVTVFSVVKFLVLSPLKSFRISIEKDERLKLTGSREFRLLARTYNSIYEIKAKNEKELLFNAEYDALTSVLNRRAFEQICKRCSEEKDKIALLIINLDNFKELNEAYSREAGDKILKILAQQLKSTFRKNDYVCRISGDEFAVFLRSLKADPDEAIINKVSFINAVLNEISDVKRVSVSVGAAISQEGYTEELFDQAYSSLQKVKASGKANCLIYKNESES